jgi:hypothetical protein
MANIKPTSAAKIASAIVADLESRSGFKGVFATIEAGVKNEIQERIVTLITDAREAAEKESQEPKGSKDSESKKDSERKK